MKMKASGDQISAVFGAPQHWMKNEIGQMKKIHQAYRIALVDPTDLDEDDDDKDLMNLSQTETYMTIFGTRESSKMNLNRGLSSVPQEEDGDEEDDEDSGSNNRQDGGAVGESSGKGRAQREARDPESFLPGDSPLRTRNDGREPKFPFKDYQSFLASTDFNGYWKDNFRSQHWQDKVLCEIAGSLVHRICVSQASGQLRVRHGSIPMGKFLRKKREHLTPLSMTLHEVKLWAAKLANYNPFDESTYKELKRRVKYLGLLQRKEVWGATVSLPTHSGMRPIAHDQLFRLLLTAKEDLTRAHEYAFRQHMRRCAREKLTRLQGLLKDVVFLQMRIYSGLFARDSLSSAKARALQPSDLLSSWKNQVYVDYQNFANVCMKSFVDLPLVRACLLSDFGNDDVKASLVQLSQWSEHNLFVRSGSSSSDDAKKKELTILLDEENGLLPEIYKNAAQTIKDELAKADPHHKPPANEKSTLKFLRKNFRTDEVIQQVMQRWMKGMAALQDLVPALYITFELWTISGIGGDFILYDVLRENCIAVMKETINRLVNVQLATKNLLKFYGSIVQTYEETIERKRLLSKKSKYDPTWISNYHHLKADLLPLAKRNVKETYLSLCDILQDAWTYDLTAEMLNDKVDNLKQACQVYAPSLHTQLSTKSSEVKFNNWLQLHLPSRKSTRRSKRRDNEESKIIQMVQESANTLLSDGDDDATTYFSD